MHGFKEKYFSNEYYGLEKIDKFCVIEIRREATKEPFRLFWAILVSIAAATLITTVCSVVLHSQPFFRPESRNENMVAARIELLMTDLTHSVEPAGIFTGHTHRPRGYRLTFGVDTYKNVFGSPEDTSCVPGTYSEPGGTRCLDCTRGNWCPGGPAPALRMPCSPHATSLPGSTQESDCECRPGTYGPEGGKVCALCQANWLCMGGSERRRCPANTFSEEGDLSCTCEPGFEGDMAAGCRVCRPGWYCLGGRASFACPAGSISPPQSDSAEDCVCLPGLHPAAPPGDDGPDCRPGPPRPSANASAPANASSLADPPPYQP